MSLLDELEAEVKEERPAFLTKNPKMSLDDIEAEVKSAPAPKETRPFPDVKGEMEGLKRDYEAAAKPSRLDAAFEGIAQGASLGFGDELTAATGRLGDLVTGKEGPSYTERRDAIRAYMNRARSDHPWAFGGGELAGGTAVTAAIPGLGPAAGAGWRGVALAGAKQGAVSGVGNSNADLTKGEVLPLARDAAVSAGANALIGGAIGKVIRKAPERVDDRLLRNISRGEAGGAAKDKLYKNLVAKAGDEVSELNDTLSRFPGVKQALATSSAANPTKAARVATAVVKDIGERLDPIYEAIDKGPAVPKAVDLQNALIELRQGLVSAGKTAQADAVETFERHIAKHFGDGDAVLDAATIPASSLRNMKRTVGEVAFKDLSAASTPDAVQAKRAIYGALDDAINQAGANTPGVDIAKLARLNKDASTMIAVRDTLADRSTKALAGRTSLYQNLLRSGVMGAAAGNIMGSGGGGVGTAAAALAAPSVIKGAAQVGRRVDYRLAQLVRAARAGSKPAQLGQMALELGMSRAAAEAIAEKGPGVFEQIFGKSDAR